MNHYIKIYTYLAPQLYGPRMKTYLSAFAINITNNKLAGIVSADPNGAGSIWNCTRSTCISAPDWIFLPKSSVLIGIIDPSLTKRGISDSVKLLFTIWGPSNFSPLNQDIYVPYCSSNIAKVHNYIGSTYWWYPNWLLCKLSYSIDCMCDRSYKNVFSKKVLCTKEINSDCNLQYVIFQSLHVPDDQKYMLHHMSQDIRST